MEASFQGRQTVQRSTTFELELRYTTSAPEDKVTDLCGELLVMTCLLRQWMCIRTKIPATTHMTSFSFPMAMPLCKFSGRATKRGCGAACAKRTTREDASNAQGCSSTKARDVNAAHSAENLGL